MRLYSGKIAPIAEEIITTLVRSNAIEVASEAEARLDIEAVLKEYARQERDLVEAAKNQMETRGLGYSALGKVKSTIAREKKIPTGDDALPFLLEQILHILFHSSNIDEVFADDIELRTKITAILKKHMTADSGLDAEVRKKIKNLEEGSQSFEIEYAKVMEQLKRTKGLT